MTAPSRSGQPTVGKDCRRWLLSLGLLPLAASAWCQAVADASAPPARPAWRLDALYKADLLHAGTVGIDTAVDSLDLALSLDAEQIFGWPATTIRIEALAAHGGKPNRRLQSFGGISNLEVAQSSARLYATWIAHDFGPSWNLLAGLYDLNSEFYSTDASALFIHPAFGIGTEFAQSGRNGPSIFPNLAMTVRLRGHTAAGFYAQAAVLDGVAGDPEHPGRTSVHLSRRDGALVVGEGGWQSSQTGGRVGVGVWAYTQASPALDGGASRANRGGYALAQAVILAGPTARSTGFIRIGRADGRVNAVDAAGEAGVLVEQPFGARGPASFGLGATAARPGPAWRTLQRQSGREPASAEVVVEADARWRVGRHLAVQPVLQRIWNVGGRRAASATVAGLHLDWALQPASP